MWAQPILVELESSDKSLFVPAMTTTQLRSATSTIRSQTSEATQTTNSTKPSSDSGLSTGAKAGVGFGVGVGALGAVALVAAIFLFRRRKQPKPRVEDTSTPLQSYHGGPFSQPSTHAQPGYYSSQYHPTYQFNNVYAAELNGNKDQPGEGGLPPAELEGKH